MLKYGAEVNARTDNGVSPLMFAVDSHNPKEKETSVKIAQVLIENGADVKLFDMHGTTPIYTAAQNGIIECVQLFLQNDANVNARTSDFSRPIHAALANGYYNIAKLLIENGADPTGITDEGFSTLHIAANKYTY